MYYIRDPQSATRHCPRMETCVVSGRGRLRPNNEDNYLLDGRINLDPDSEERHMERISLKESGAVWHMFAVFDGMGGGEKGELASRRAAELFRQAYFDLSEGTTKDEIDSLVRECFLKANDQIVALREKYRILGTTGTVLCTNGTVFKIYHLGDSRGYLLRDGILYQLTRDQTLAQLKVDIGIYTEDDSLYKIEQHKLTEYIGRDQTREGLLPAESEWLNICSGDSVLLCSDGLYDMCSDRQIARLMKEASSAEEAAQKVMDAALEAGGADNITCLLTRFLVD